MTLPSGTVTFLFTDVEGSTRLWEEDAGSMRVALARHDALHAEYVQRHEGAVVKSRGEGDSLFAVFSRATGAVAAARELQEAFVSEQWATATPLRVRMALHTGEADLREGDYYGSTVNRCARLRAIAHGGQVLLSRATQELVRDALPERASLLDLGLHRLQDLSQPEHVFQLVHPALPFQFPPLRSLGALPNNLPRQLTSFIGREREIAEVKRLLGTTALLTLTGAGGCGKTRLALQVAADLLGEYPDGVWLVALEALSDPALVPQAIASALGVREAPGRTLSETLSEHLESKRLLLVLDNCEHLIGSCAHAADTLLRACPELRILATSRAALGIAGERTYRVPSLSLPDPDPWPPTGARFQVPGSRFPDAPTSHAGPAGPGSPRDRPAPGAHPPPPGALAATLTRSEAVRLFNERALFSRSDFTLTDRNAPVVAQVCRRLDGIPLAIELAAARVQLLTVEQLAARLDDRFRLLTGGSRTALPRQQTLQATIDWSYDLLSQEEQVLLRRLSVFPGSFTLEAAEAVCACGAGVKREALSVEADLLNAQRSTLNAPLEEGQVLDLMGQLVDKSLVMVVEHEAESRYRLLETIRQYGAGKLAESAEGPMLSRRHRDWYVALAERAAPELRGPDQQAWLERLEQEHDNLRAALGFSVESGDAEAGSRLAIAVSRFWMVRGYLTEGREQLAAVLALTDLRSRKSDPGSPTAGNTLPRPHPAASHPPSEMTRAKLLNAAGVLAWQQGATETARVLYRESLAIRRELGDPRDVARALINLGLIAEQVGDYGEARALHEESLSIYREAGDNYGVANALSNLGNVAHHQGDHAGAAAFCQESLTIWRASGNKFEIANCLTNLGCAALFRGDYPAARSFLEESLALRKEIGDKAGIATSLMNLGVLAHYESDYTLARARLEDTLPLWRELDNKLGLASALGNLGDIVLDLGEYEEGRALHAQSLRLRRELGDRPGIVECLEGLARVASAGHQPDRAARLFGAAQSLRDTIGASSASRERAELERHTAAARDQMDDAAFAAAWAEGQAMSLEQGIAYALEL